jgi:hypothetical protein
LKTLTPQLPTILGSLAAMLVAFLALMNGTSPATCMAKAASAFLVFAGFGLVLRFALSEAADKSESDEPRADQFGSSLDVIVPGTSVADLLGVRSDESQGEGGNDEQLAA